MKRILSLAAALLVWTGASAEIFNPHDEAEAAILRDIDAYVQLAMGEWAVPGYAMAIVKDGQLVFAKGYGVKDIENPSEKVDEHTLFKIASVSKAFTPVIMAQLVEEGKVSWDTPVVDIIPEFRMRNPKTARAMVVSDVFCHNSGIFGQQGSMFYCLGFDREDMLKILPVFKEGYEYGQGYDYNTLFYSISSILVERLTGKSWEENLRERVLLPLGMTGTTVGGEGLKAATNKAASHNNAWSDGLWKVTRTEGEPYHRLTQIGSAGAIVSNVVDMTKWCRFHLEGGLTSDGRRLISPESVRRLHSGQNLKNDGEWYGYGWTISHCPYGEYWQHTGSGLGHTDVCCWHPELNLGIMISCNTTQTGPRKSVCNRIFGLYRGCNPEDDRAQALAIQIAKVRKSQESSARVKAATLPSPETIVGNYYSRLGLGKAAVTLEEDGRLYLTIGRYGWKLLLEPGIDAYTFLSDGVRFKLLFDIDDGSGKCKSLIVKSGAYYRNWAVWKKVS